jgi:hypothetical protein
MRQYAIFKRELLKLLVRRIIIEDDVCEMRSLELSVWVIRWCDLGEIVKWFEDGQKDGSDVDWSAQRKCGGGQLKID